MVKLHVKKGEHSQFLYETSVNVSLDDLVRDVTAVYNGRLKIARICLEMLELAKHGASLPPEMQGLSKDQESAELVDHWTSQFLTCTADDQFVINEDPALKRNGKAPSDKMADVLKRPVAEATSAISDESVPADMCLTIDLIHEHLEELRAAIAIVYPQNLPTYDPIRRELENKEDLKGTQLEVIDLESAQLWWAGKELQRGKKLADFVGRNEKTKIIVKLQKAGHGPPSREPVVTEEQRKQMMLQAHRRQQELERLDDDDDDTYLNSSWADQQTWKKSFHGVQNINWKPK